LIDRDEVSTVGRGVLLTPLDSGHGITCLPSPWFLSCQQVLERWQQRQRKYRECSPRGA
jgi:hypothetical protein